MRSNIKLPIGKYTPTELLALTRNVVSKMTDNANFPTPIVALKSISDKADELETAIREATHGSRQSKLHRNDVVAEVQDLLRSQAEYVRGVCNGDRTMLESSGYELSKIPEKRGIPSAPIMKEAKMTGISGQVKLKWNSIKEASMYQVWMTDSDPVTNPNWTPVSVTTKITASVDNLTSYTAYWFSVSAINSAGEGAKSDPAVGRAA